MGHGSFFYLLMYRCISGVCNFCSDYHCTCVNVKSAKSIYHGVDIIFIQVQVRCSLVYMDFEGRSDGRSIKNILSHVAPLKLVRISLVLFN